MPHPKHGYHLASGEKCPGVTTVIGRFKESGGLMQWAFQQGKAGKATLYEEAEKAADIGTRAHAMVEHHIKGIPYADTDAAVKSAFDAYLHWERMTNLRIIEQEMQLVSECYRYGGTPDAIGTLDNQLCLLDWKTSNKIYPDYIIQVAAYKNLWEENFPDRPLTGGCHILRFAKEHADFNHMYLPDVSEGWEQFKLFRAAYDLDKALAKRCK